MRYYVQRFAFLVINVGNLIELLANALLGIRLQMKGMNVDQLFVQVK